MNRQQRQGKDLGVRELLKGFREPTSGLDPLTCSLRMSYLKIKGASHTYCLEFSQARLTPDIGKGGPPSKRRVLLPYRTCRSKSSIVFATCFPNSSNNIVRWLGAVR